MTGPIKLKAPLSDSDVAELKIGDEVLLSGVIYAARDAAHTRLMELLASGKELPIKIEGQVLYYVGPAPPRPGEVIGPAGPTTSCRMDPYTPPLLKLGLKGMIGKGKRSEEVIEAMKKHRAVYFAAVGGAAPLLMKKIKKAELVAFEELGTGALRRLEVEDFPLIVANDIYGNDLYDAARKRYSRAASRGRDRKMRD